MNAIHRATLIGFVPYLLAFGVAINALESSVWHLETMMRYIHPVAYVLLLGYRTHAAWSGTVSTSKVSSR